MDPNNPMVTQLLHRWRDVWRMSVDRKKRLQDYLEHLLEVSSCFLVLLSIILTVFRMLVSIFILRRMTLTQNRDLKSFIRSK